MMPLVYQAYISLGLLKLDLAELASVELVQREHWNEAGVHFFRAHEALDAYEAVIEGGLVSSSRRTELRQLRVEARLNDGKLLLMKRDYEGAISKLTVVLDSAQEISDDSLRFQALGLMGRAYSGLGEHTLAIEQCYDHQLSLAKSQKDAALEAEALFNLAMAYRDVRDYDLALQALYLYKDHLKMQLFDEHKLGDADVVIAETIDLKETAEGIVRTESKVDKSLNPEKYFFTLAKGCHKLGLIRDATTYACRLVESQIATGDLDEVSLILAAELCIEQKLPDDAIFYCKKLLEYLESSDRARDQPLVDALVLLAEAYWLLPTLPGEILRALQRALEACRDNNLKEHEILVLSKLALSYSKLGLDDDYLRFKDKCLLQWSEMRRAEDEEKLLEAQKLTQELENLDYFVNRKPSKNVMKLVDGQFNLKSRSKANVKGLEIKKTQRPRRRPTVAALSNRTLQKKKTGRIISDGEGGDLAAFVVDDECASSTVRSKSRDDRDVRSRALSRLERDAMKGDSSRLCSNSMLRKYPRIEESDDEAGVGGPLNGSSSIIGLRKALEDVYDTPMSDSLVWSPSPKRSLPADERASVCSRSADGSKHAWKGDLGTIASVLRLTVIIDGEALIIPVIDDIAERKTVAWLIKEASQRFEAEFARSPIIEALCNERGARLVANDPVALVVSDGEQVHARVAGFRKKSLLQWYEELCAEYGLMQEVSLGECLRKQEGTHIDLSHWYWEGGQFEVTVRSICKYAEASPVTGLNLANNPFLTDELVVRLCESIKEHVLVVDFSFSSIHSSSLIVEKCKKLERISLAFCCELTDVPMLIRTIARRGLDSALRTIDLSGVNVVGSENMGDLHYLGYLEELAPSFCQLDVTTGEGLGELLRKSTSLKRLDLSGCEGSAEVWRPIVEALKVNYFLKTLILDGCVIPQDLLTRMKYILVENGKSSLMDIKVDGPDGAFDGMNGDNRPM